MPVKHSMLFRARFAKNNRFCCSSSNLNDSRLNVDIVVNAPRRPTVKNNLLESGRANAFSLLYVMKLRVNAPRMFTPRVPSGKRDEPCIVFERRNLNTAPMNPPMPT